ncbi:SBBP repeat-containing protein [Lysobacter sp. CFH 32150]|uniref:DUF7948 domain-containing protein n=1 Tax=Lysobacter sp. CFH 32150 TaxID=2927128 RepID=UPI001FA6EA89|nr:SBBP repeat-containing protein [Lysobacter sp. CFH 32150]MCI4567961.1 SBBP repeat-containing protein [Lysobacter sp. CFH 32150]
MHQLRLATPLVALSLLIAPAMVPGTRPAVASPSASIATAPIQAQARVQFEHLPLTFERNQGQTDPSVQFFSRGPGYSLFLTPGEAVVKLSQAPSPQERRPGQQAPLSKAPAAVVRMALTGARRDAQMEGLEPQASKSHYFRGNDAAQWQHDVEHYGKVRYRAVYDGIDVVYYGKQQQLEYDLLVAPGADPAQIGLAFDGTQDMRLDDAGNLVLATPQGDLLQHKPVAYQDIAGERRLVAAHYELRADDQVAIALGAYDKSQLLVIDPVLSYSSYLGGSADDFAAGVVVDGSGNTYLTGFTQSLDFPRAGGGQANNGGGADAFVTKIDANGALVYSSYLGGAGDDVAYGIALDASGNVYLTGNTNSANFPLRSPLQGALLGTTNAFVTKLNAAGNALVYSTYLGVNEDFGNGIVVDGGGNAYVSGYTKGGLVFLGTPFQSNYGGGDYDGVLIKLNAAGSDIVFGTYLGGSSYDIISDIALDASGNVYVVGYTASYDFPTWAAFQPFNSGIDDAFVAKFDSSGNPHYSTFLGGALALDLAQSVAVDAAGNAYVAGMTYRGAGELSDFPVFNPLQEHGGKWDVFVTKFNATGQTLLYSTFVGGSENEDATAIAVDAAGNAYVGGRTSSPNFPTASPWQAFSGGGDDAYVIKIKPNATDLVWSSFLGGTLADRILSLAVDGAGKVHATGRTYGDFPLESPHQSTGSGRDAFLARVGGVTPTSLRYRHNDANDDGRADILWRNTSTGANVLWSAANYDIQRPVARTGLDWIVAGTGDFNGDHRTDLLWRNHKTGANFIWRSAFQSSGQGVTAVNNLAWVVAGIGDFDGDGKSDILWRNTTDGANMIWKAANSATQQAVTGVTNQIWKIVGVGDFNGDGKADILWRNSSTGANTIWKSANSTTQQGVAGIASQDWKVLGVGDFDGDGKSDILWRNTVTGVHMIWKSANASTQQAVTSVTNQIWKIAGVADFNGDGKSDILWRNSSTGANTIWKSANSTTQQAVTGITDQAWVPIP